MYYPFRKIPILQQWLPFSTTQAGLVLVGAVAAGEVNSATTTMNLSLTGQLTGGIATSPSAGDLVLAVVAGGALADLALELTGDGTYTDYTEVQELYENDSEDTNIAVFAKFQGSTPDATLTARTLSANTGRGRAMGCVVLRGAHSTWSSQTPTQATITDSNRVNPAAITPAHTGAWGLVFAALSALGASMPATPAISGWTTLCSAIGQGSTSALKLLVAMQQWSGSGAMDPPAVSDANADSANNSAVALTVAVRPA
jgi:hypothetical protein